MKDIIALIVPIVVPIITYCLGYRRCRHEWRKSNFYILERFSDSALTEWVKITNKMDR